MKYQQEHTPALVATQRCIQPRLDFLTPRRRASDLLRNGTRRLGDFALDTQPISHQRTLEGRDAARRVHRPIANVAQQNESLIISTAAFPARVH